MKYLWEETIKRNGFSSLEGDVETDVLIIGGGLAGVLCAYMLKLNDVDHILVEGRAVGSGTAKGTTAVLTAQHSDVYSKITRKYGKETAAGYLNANLRAIEKYAALAHEFNFDFEYRDSYIYSVDDKSRMEAEAAAVGALGFTAEFTETTELPFEVAGAIRFPKMAQFHPLKLIMSLCEKINVYEHTHINRVEGNTAFFENGSVKARKIVIATRFPFINTKGLYPVKLYQRRSFALALENAPELDGTYADVFKRGIYMRNYKNLLIVGGGDHRTGSRNDGFETVRRFVKQYLPDSHEKYAWAAQDCMSLDSIPYVGNYSSTLDDVYVISGFNEWGMSSAMAAASIIKDKVMGVESEFEHVFSPNRGIFTKQTAINLAGTLVNFIIPKTKRCPHLGCALRKNHDENTWDCPCHGSRFDADGELLDNPALHDIQ